MNKSLLQILFVTLSFSIAFAQEPMNSAPIKKEYQNEFFSTLCSIPNKATAERISELKKQMLLDSKGKEWQILDITFDIESDQKNSKTPFYHLTEIQISKVGKSDTKMILSNKFGDYLLLDDFKKIKHNLTGKSLYPVFDGISEFRDYDGGVLDISITPRFEISTVQAAIGPLSKLTPFININENNFLQLVLLNDEYLTVCDKNSEDQISFYFKKREYECIGGSIDNDVGIIDRKIIKRNWRKLVQQVRYSFNIKSFEFPSIWLGKILIYEFNVGFDFFF